MLWVFGESVCAEGSPAGIRAVSATRRLEIEALIPVVLKVAPSEVPIMRVDGRSRRTAVPISSLRSQVQ